MKTTGDVFLELEVLINQLVDDHGWQWGDILWWTYGHLKIHRPDAQEQYVAGGSPHFEYEYKPTSKKKPKKRRKK